MMIKDLFITALKVILIIVCVIFTIGFGICGAVGLASVSINTENPNASGTFGLAILGIALSAFLGWLTTKIAKSIKPLHSQDRDQTQTEDQAQE